MINQKIFFAALQTVLHRYPMVLQTKTALSLTYHVMSWEKSQNLLQLSGKVVVYKELKGETAHPQVN